MDALPLRTSRRVAIALAMGACLASPGIALADTLYADGHADAGPQFEVDLGIVAPGAVIDVPFSFLNHCTNGTHLDADQVVTFTFAGGTAPEGGHIVGGSDGSVGPAPAGWPGDGFTCPNGTTYLTGTAGTVTIQAPAAAGDHEFLISWDKVVDPPRAGDSLAIRGLPALTIRLDVVANEAPVVSAPDVVTVEGNTTGGWAIDWSGIAGATDAEDGALPVSCSFNAPSVLSVGSWTILCSATDSLGATGHDAFALNVVDTAAPGITGHGSINVTTGDAGGAVVTYDPPAATDVVDASPTVTCAPPSGDTFAVGTTPVTCTATDDSGNSSSTAFDVVVTHEAPPIPPSAGAVWGEPVGPEGGTFVANHGRTIPVKVALWVGDSAQTAGSAVLTITPCGGGSGVTQALTYAGGRWNANFDTSRVGPGCYTVTASIDGVDAGSFQLELQGDTAEKATGKKK